MFQFEKALDEFYQRISESHHPAFKLNSDLIQAREAISSSHGEMPQWNQALCDIMNLAQEHSFESQMGDAVSMESSELNIQGTSELLSHFKKLNPWRKGPFEIQGTLIDTEWQSWMKWNRLKDWITPHIEGKNVLDIGCSSGYYMFRMLEHSPKWILGIDPTQVFYHQFLAIQALLQEPRLDYLPVGSEALDSTPRFFDTVFCMGILYHRKSPFEFIRSLQGRLKPGGTLILETMMVPGEGHWALTPVDRYARMRNCFTLPTKDALIHWLEQFGFKDVEWIHEDWTTIQEQRSTEWMQRESLIDCLDPNDSKKTVEGYSAPLRCLVKATAK